MFNRFRNQFSEFVKKCTFTSPANSSVVTQVTSRSTTSQRNLCVSVLRDTKTQTVTNIAPSTPLILEEAEIDGRLNSTEQAPSRTARESSAPQAYIFKDLTIDEILTTQNGSQTLHDVHENDSVYECIGLMSSLNIGCVMVQNSRGEYTGIFSERDYLNKVALHGLSSKEISVKEIMTKNVVWVNSNETAAVCMDLMTTRNFRHLPVKNSFTQEAIGMISIGDLVRTVRDNSIKL